MLQQPLPEVDIIVAYQILSARVLGVLLSLFKRSFQSFNFSQATAEGGVLWIGEAR
jgi:hypothetical protein